jgi:ferredoxin
MPLTIDSSKCQGHGRCALINPDLFDVGDDSFGYVVNPEPRPEQQADVTKAIENCPEEAISYS